MTRRIPNLPDSFAGEHTDAEEAAMREYERDQEAAYIQAQARQRARQKQNSKFAELEAQ